MQPIIKIQQTATNTAPDESGCILNYTSDDKMGLQKAVFYGIMELSEGERKELLRPYIEKHRVIK